MSHKKIESTSFLVLHQQFGEGEIVTRRLTGSGNDVVDVKFESGTKAILFDPRYLRAA